MARLSINLKLFFAALSRILFSGGRCFGKLIIGKKPFWKRLPKVIGMVWARIWHSLEIFDFRAAGIPD